MFSLVRATLGRFSSDRCPRMAAALAYYTVFSLAPLLVVCMWIAGLFFESQRVQSQLGRELQNFLGPQATQQVLQMMQHAAAPGAGVSLARIASIGVLLFGASGLVLELQTTLNEIWRVRARPKGNAIKRIVLKRVLSFTMVLVVGLLLIASMFVNMWLNAVSQVAQNYLGGEMVQAVLLSSSSAVSFVATIVLLIVIFKYLPDAQISWRHVALGAVLTAVMMAVGKWGVSFYLGRKNLGSLYGAAGSLVLVLAWVYYSSMILLLGAEFTYVWAHRKGERVPPEQGAESTIPPPVK